jgi:hypothetical protein
MTLCHPLSYGRRTEPSKEAAELSKGDGRLFHARSGPCRDVRSVKHVPSVTISPVQPPPPSRRHPEHCSAIPGVVGSTRWRGATTPVDVLHTASRQLHPRICTRVATGRKTPTPPPSKPFLDGYRAHHDVPPKARFAKTAIYSTALYATPPHINKIVRHACKLPPP